MKRVMLTTIDNPYNPFTQYDLWSSYDEKVCGYNSASLLARFAPVSPDESRAVAIHNTERAIQRIMDLDLPIFNPTTGERSQYIRVEDN